MLFLLLPLLLPPPPLLLLLLLLPPPLLLLLSVAIRPRSAAHHPVQVLLQDKCTIARAPDGNGGMCV